VIDMGSLSLGLMLGAVLMALVMGVGFYWMLQRGKAGKDMLPHGAKGSFIAALCVLTLIGAMVARPPVIFAVDDTPVPLVIPINAIFTQANNWLSTLSPIASLGIGIIIALAAFG
jgi:hypothetical protein